MRTPETAMDARLPYPTRWVEAGADGIFFATQGASYRLMSEAGWQMVNLAMLPFLVLADNNGFVKYPIKRVYIPLTSKGRLAIKLGMHKAPKDALPEFLKGVIIPTANGVSRI